MLANGITHAFYTVDLIIFSSLLSGIIFYFVEIMANLAIEIESVF